MSNQIELAAERLMKLEPDIRAALEARPNEADTRLKCGFRRKRTVIPIESGQ